MKLPDFILNYARNHCNIKATDKKIFKFVKMLFENHFDDPEMEILIDYIDDLEAWSRCIKILKNSRRN